MSFPASVGFRLCDSAQLLRRCFTIVSNYFNALIPRAVLIRGLPRAISHCHICMVIAKYVKFIMNCSLVSDDSFGPQYCDDFDFTLVFEQSLFQIAPCALLLLALPIRASQLRRQEAKCAK